MTVSGENKFGLDGKLFSFAFEYVFILSPSLTQGEKEVLFKVVIVMIKRVNIF